MITPRFRSPQFIPSSLIPSAPGERNPFLPTINDAHALSGSPEAAPRPAAVFPAEATEGAAGKRGRRRGFMHERPLGG